MAVATQRFLTSRARWFVFGLLVIVAVYLLAVTPARTYLHQRQQMAMAEQRYEALRSANQDLSARVAALQNDATIAQLARDRYELVPEGAEAYAVMPPAVAGPAPEAASDSARPWFSKAADTLSFWD